MADGPNHIEFDAVTTLDDYVAMFLYAQRRPRRLLDLLILGAAAFVWFTVTFMVQNLFNNIDSLNALGDREVLQAYVDTQGWSDLVATARPIGAWTGGILLFIVLVLLPLQARTYAKRLLRERPDVDTKDRKLTQRNHCRLDDEGYSWSVPDTRTRFAWSNFTHLVETRRHLFMMISPSSGVVFPKRTMDRLLVDEVRVFATSHVGRPQDGAAPMEAA